MVNSLCVCHFHVTFLAHPHVELEAHDWNVGSATGAGVAHRLTTGSGVENIKVLE